MKVFNTSGDSCLLLGMNLVPVGQEAARKADISKQIFRKAFF